MERQSCPVSFKIFRRSAHSVHFQNWPQNQASQKIVPPIQTTEKWVCFFAWNLELILSNSEGRSSSSVLSCLAYYAWATWGVVIELTKKTEKLPVVFDKRQVFLESWKHDLLIHGPQASDFSAKHNVQSNTYPRYVLPIKSVSQILLRYI